MAGVSAQEEIQQLSHHAVREAVAMEELLTGHVKTEIST